MCDLGLWNTIVETLARFRAPTARQLQSIMSEIDYIVDTGRGTFVTEKAHHCDCDKRGVLMTMVGKIAAHAREHHLVLLRTVFEPFEALGAFAASARDYQPGVRRTRLCRNCPMVYGLAAVFDARLSDDALSYAAELMKRAEMRAASDLGEWGGSIALGGVPGGALEGLICCVSIFSPNTAAFRSSHTWDATFVATHRARARCLLDSFPDTKELLTSGWCARPCVPAATVRRVWDWMVGLIIPQPGEACAGWRLLQVFSLSQVVALLPHVVTVDASLLRALEPDRDAVLAACGETLIGSRPAFASDARELAEFGFWMPPADKERDLDSLLYSLIGTKHTHCAVMASPGMERHKALALLTNHGRSTELPSVRFSHPHNILSALVVLGKLLCSFSECFDTCDPGSRASSPLPDRLASQCVAQIIEYFAGPGFRDFGSTGVLPGGREPPPMCAHVAHVLLLHAPTDLDMPAFGWLRSQKLVGIQFLELPIETV